MDELEKLGYPKIHVKQENEDPLQLYSVTEFSNIEPEVVLEELLSKNIMKIPFFVHLLSNSQLFNTEKKIFGLSFSHTEVYYYKDESC